jgi:hypothetical protein
VFVANKLTEFFLYGTYLVSTGHRIDEYYKFDNTIGSNIWRAYDNATIRSIIANVDTPFFGVHRSTFRNMDAGTQHILAKFWHERHLFVSYQNALRFVKGCAITYSQSK